LLSLAFICLLFLLVYSSSNLLLSLIVLELVSMVTLLGFSYFMSWGIFSDHLLIIFFRVFIIEGVVGLSGLIILVFFTGSDYIRVSSILKV